MSAHRFIILAALTLVFATPSGVFAQAKPCVTLTHTLSLGSTGTEVSALQTFFTKIYANFPSPTGKFDLTTEDAVKQWQKTKGIVASGNAATTGYGSVGARTRAAMVCASASATNTSNSTVSSTIISRTLSFGMRGTDVTTLQLQLVAKGYLSAESATGYFGVLTEAAVQKFQAQQGIVSNGAPATTGYGAVGPRTRAALSSVATTTTSSSDTSTNTTSSGTGTSGSTTTSNTSTVPTTNSCTFYGTTVVHGAIVTAYQSSSVAYGQTCTQEVRTCSNGTLSGSYTNAACGVLGSTTNSCTFNNAAVAHGASVTAYQSSSVAYGSSCTSQSRICSNGTLSGSYTNAACTVGTAASCTFNGQTVANGAAVTAYQSSSVASGSSCVSQARTCTNGTLSGSYTNAACSVLGSTTNSCTFNGTTVAHGAAVTAYQASSVAYGSTCTSQSRTCSNGTLSGSYTYGACTVATATSCTFNNATVAHGASVAAYQASSVAYGSSCVSQSRTCTNGTLSGSYTNAACTVAAATSCIFNGSAIANGAAVTAYQASSVASGSLCVSQSRTCTNGTLSGTYTNATCNVLTSTTNSCTFNNATVAHGASVAAYQSSSVAYGQTCTQQTRTCSNGTLSGSYTNATCSVLASTDLCLVTAESGGPSIGAWQAPTRYRVYQRHGSSADVPVGITLGGTTQCVQSRVLDSNGTEIVPWTTISSGTYSAGQNVSGTITIPNGGWYKVMVRAINSGAAGPAGGIDFVGVGEVFVTAGQSNSTFWGQVPQHTATGKVSYFDGATWQLCQDPLPAVDSQSAGGSPWCLLGDQIVNGYGVPAAFAPTGWGGTNITQWQKDSPTSPAGTGVLYARLMQMVQYFGANGIRAVLWHQGESDIGTSQYDYASKLVALILGSRASSGSATPWIVAMATYPNDWTTSQATFWRNFAAACGDAACIAGQEAARSEVRQAQASVAQGNSNAVYPGPDTDTLTTSYRYDGIHMNVAGLNAHATLWAGAINTAIQQMGN
ncbi:MAG: hypothetical protein JWM46_37 [Candidatus Kaiserbacteria bacterium]|nr:hypothetical protein [Candidatus Kaiserbacteria bacterium]